MIWWNMNHTALFFVWVRCPCVWLPVALNATVCGSFGFKSCFLSWAFLFSFCVRSQTSVGSWMLFEDAPCCWISKSLSNTQKAQVNLKWTLLVFTLFCLPRCEYHAGPCWAWQTEEQRRGSGAVSLPPFGFLAGFLCPPPCWGHSGKKKSLWTGSQLCCTQWHQGTFLCERRLSEGRRRKQQRLLNCLPSKKDEKSEKSEQ